MGTEGMGLIEMLSFSFILSARVQTNIVPLLKPDYSSAKALRYFSTIIEWLTYMCYSYGDDIFLSTKARKNSVIAEA
jgi:hypothetical protein